LWEKSRAGGKAVRAGWLEETVWAGKP